jgi:hypothetical protein
VRSTLPKLLLLMASLVLALVLFEIALRLLAPQYEYAASSVHEWDSFRIYSRRPNSAYARGHPDSGERHLVIHNNLAMRQHRDLPVSGGPGEVRVGLFGDSFTENLRIPAQYSLSEVLDFLLDLHGGPYTVLNFGVDGYGPDQSYLYYRSSEAARDLRHVVYLFAVNDVRNLYENGLLELAADGSLSRNRALATPFWLSLVARSYTAYFVLDVRSRLVAWWTSAELAGARPRDLLREEKTKVRQRQKSRRYDTVAASLEAELLEGASSPGLERVVALFRKVLEEWRAEVVREGGRFHVMLLPRQKEARARFLFEGFDVIDLAEEFSVYGDESGWRFENDGHWNERGNRLAAVHLYRHLSGALGLEPRSDAAIDRELHVYYGALSGGFESELESGETDLSEVRVRELRATYLELEERHSALLR